MMEYTYPNHLATHEVQELRDASVPEAILVSPGLYTRPDDCVPKADYTTNPMTYSSGSLDPPSEQQTPGGSALGMVR